MEAAVEHLSMRFLALRSGSANSCILDNIQVECYGTQVKFNSVAVVLAPDKRNLIIRPFDSNIIPEIEKAIVKAKIGLCPVRESGYIRLPVPALSGERQKELVKEARNIAEDQKVSIRNIRREAIKASGLVDRDKQILFKGDVETLTKCYIEKVESMLNAKIDSLLDVENKWK